MQVRISNTGKYKLFPPIGMIVTFVALIFFARMEVSTTLWQIGIYLFVLGVGLGLAMQVLVLIVQNTLPTSWIYPQQKICAPAGNAMRMRCITSWRSTTTVLSPQLVVEQPASSSP